MAMQSVICVGDSTTHGGVVLTGSSCMQINGRAVARRGDRVSCPRHGDNLIVGGHADFCDDGTPVALHGHQTQCGCTLLASDMAAKVG